MLSLIALQKIFSNLYKDYTGKEYLSIVPIAESGSARKYFRICGLNDSYIGTYNDNILENRSFFSLSETFADFNLPVPKVLAKSENELCYLQTDFGDISLFDIVQQEIINGTFSDRLIQLYKESILYLIQFQVIATQKIDYSKCFPSAIFTKQAIFDDLEYFKYYFVKLHPQIQFNEALLSTDFENFANFTANTPGNHFMFRDFQSRNIMVKDDKLYFIDFQGGRKGPLQYDLVSLLFQVKAQMPDPVREELLGFYLKEINKYIKFDENEFLTYYKSFIYLRLFQVLGAYGFRGLIQKKSHFIDSIPFGLETLQVFYHKNGFSGKYPEIERIMTQLSALNNVYPINNSTKNTALIVQISSFSYLKKGIPFDTSGNGGGHVFDCRALPNPGREVKYKLQTGKDQDVIDFLNAKDEVSDFFENIKKICHQSISNYAERGFNSLMINFGCTGGQHRSVFLAEKTFEWAKKQFPEINFQLQHTEIT